MTDAELNEIFRAIRHRRTLSWATIEKMANEVREARKPKTLKVQVPQYGWNHYGDLIQTTMFPPKREDDLSAKAKEYLDRISASIKRSYEDKMLDGLLRGQSVMTCNVDPDKPTMGGTRLMKSVEEFDWDAVIYQQDVRPRNIFNSVMPTPIADSRKKE